jgi:formylglycine-generating enzyme required for sulfatase activity
MNNRFTALVLRAWQIFSFSIIFLVGCEDANKTQENNIQEGVRFFEMDEIRKDALPAIIKLAKEEGLIRIDAGEFLMGSPLEEVGRKPDELRNRVKISQPFWIKKFEVTQGDWNKHIASNQKKGDPVFSLSSKILNEICSSSGYAAGNFSIIGFQGETGKEIFLEEAVLSQGLWKTAKSPRNYQVNHQKFNDLFALLKFLKSKNIQQIDRMGKFHPVSRVSYSQVVAYCWKKTQEARLNGSLPSPFVFRLPTEAEWEYACRAGTSGFCGIGEEDLLSGENANIDGSIRGYIIDQRPKSEFSDGGSFTPIFRKGYVPIRPFRPIYPSNAWGLHDMHGNVLEWCYDFYGPYPDDNLTRIDPMGPIRGSYRIARGGSFVRTAHESRSAARFSYEASYRGSEIGFRYVLGLPLR